MQDTGYIKLYRKFFAHELWAEERVFSRAEAWIDLLNLGAYKPSSRIVRGKMIRLDAGDVIASRRYLAARWHWGEQKVRTFLQMLKNNGQITHQITSGEGVITLVNYRVYNGFGAANNPPDNPPITHRQPKYKEGKEISLTQEAREFTLDDFLAAAKDPSVAISQDDARACYAHYDGEWVYGNGQPILSAATCLRRWKTKKGRNENNQANGRGTQTRVANCQTDRNAGTLNDANDYADL